MPAKSVIDQRNTYKLLEKLTSGNYKSELALLKSLIRDIINHTDFDIQGGRIWKIDREKRAYELRYQYGNVNKIPKRYSVPIAKHQVFTDLTRHRTIVNYETEQILIEKGITLYSLAGVGKLARIDGGRYYRYALGFNAESISDSFRETLSVISRAASVAIRNMTTKATQQKIKKDIIKASEIQRNLLPDHYIEFEDYKIFGTCIPDSAVGGDYFDYIKGSTNEDERLGIIISDAASKGLPAAIQALFVSGAIRMGAGFSSRITLLLSRLNDLIFRTFPYERFVTLFYCELTLSSNRLVLYANAGHCSPIHYRPETGRFLALEPTGGLLGIMEGQKFGLENVRMHPGDILVLYTDGINEALDSKGNLYGEERIRQMIMKNKSKSSEQIALHILDDVYKFSKDSNYSDDKTLVIIKRDMA